LRHEKKENVDSEFLKYEEKLLKQKKHDIENLVDEHEFLIKQTFSSHMLIDFFLQET
jgi:hypothetical protein